MTKLSVSLNLVTLRYTKGSINAIPEISNFIVDRDHSYKK